MKPKTFLFVSKNTQKTLPHIREAVDFLTKKGATVFCPEEKAFFFKGLNVTPLPEKRLSEVDVAVTFGGDGTILKTARLLLPFGVPILGVNMGTVGYLADIEPEEVVPSLQKIYDESYSLEKRCALRIECDGCSFVGINEAVVARGALSHILTINVRINGQDIETIRADGIIVSTPTGSTAYNLSAGGPIVAPLSRTFVLTPICAHSLTARPIVIGDDSVITLTVSEFRSKDVRPSLDVDGKTVRTLEEVHSVDISLAREKVVLIRTKPTSFFKTLQRKLSAATKGEQ